MKNVISLLSRVPPWLLFLLTTVPVVAPMILYFPPSRPSSDLSEVQSTFTTMMLLSIPGYLIFFSWILTVGIVCNQSFDNSVRRSERLFRFSVPFAMIYIVFATFLFPEAALSENDRIFQSVVFSAHVVATFLLLYAIAFSARSLAMLDQPHSPGFWRTTRYLLGLMYYPVGLWFIQPRVNSIAAASQNGR